MSAVANVRRGWNSGRPVLWRLLPPLAFLLLLLILGAGGLLWRQLQTHMMDRQMTSGLAVLDAVHMALKRQTDVLAGQVQPIAADPRLRQALRERNVERLQEDWLPVFTSLQKDFQFTHFNFMTPERVLLLRLHKLDLRGDVIDRANLLEAERTGKTASGLVIGEVGTLVLRVAQPIFEDGVLLGYVELGKEIEYILEEIRLPPGSYFAATIRKECLSREQWNEWLQFFGRESEWSRLSKNVVIFSSMRPLPDAFNPMANRDPNYGQGLAFRNANIVDGGREWRATSTAIRDASGNDVGELLVMTDVTAEVAAFHHSLLLGGIWAAVLLVSILGLLVMLLRRTDRFLLGKRKDQEEAHQRLLLVLNCLDALVYVADIHTHELLFVNEYGLKQFGRDIVGKPCWAALQGMSGPCPFCTQAQRLQADVERGTGQAELQNRLTGRWYSVRDASLSWTGGREVRLQIAVDITAQKESEAALRLERDKAKMYLDIAEVIFVALDREGNITLVNRKGCELLGLAQDHLLGQNWFEHFLPPGVREETFQNFKRIMAGETDSMQAYENAVLTARGEERILFWGNTVLRDDAGRVAGTFSSGIDVTDRKKMEEQLLRLQKAESLGRMAGAVAHHYNNLLQVVMGNLEMAMDDLPKMLHSYAEVEAALRASRRAANLGSVMLTYIGETFAKQDRVDLCELCRSSMPMLGLGMPKTVSLELDLPTPGPLVRVNSDQIRHLLSNLVVNAWEAMGENSGVVFLRVKVVSGESIPVLDRVPADFVPTAAAYACLEVVDTGCGIERNALNKLFDPFYTTKFTGRGLGLAVAQGTMKGHNGCMTVESEPRRGTVFRIYLPLVNGE